MVQFPPEETVSAGATCCLLRIISAHSHQCPQPGVVGENACVVFASSVRGYIRSQKHALGENIKGPIKMCLRLTNES